MRKPEQEEASVHLKQFHWMLLVPFFGPRRSSRATRSISRVHGLTKLPLDIGGLPAAIAIVQESGARTHTGSTRTRPHCLARRTCLAALQGEKAKYHRT